MFHFAGVALATLVIALAYRLSRSPVRSLAVLLLIAALIYVGFAISAGAGAAGVLRELVGVALYGALAWAGVRLSAWWLAAGWALHVAWDIGLHLLGPAAGTAPQWYAHLCLSFDLAVAGWLAFQLLRRRRHSECLR